MSNDARSPLVRLPSRSSSPCLHLSLLFPHSRNRREPVRTPRADALKEWLTFIASDELQGRQVYTEGLGLAAAYIADHLKEWGVKPAGENGSYFQTVKVVGVKTTSRASVTVDVNGQTRTFKDGEGVTFSRATWEARRR